MLEHLQTLADFFRVILGKDGDPTFTRKIQKYIERRIHPLAASMIKAESGGPPLDLFLRYVSHAGIGAIVW